MTAQRTAYAYGLATVLLWSTVASAFKVSLRHLDPAQLLLYASLVSLVVLGGILALQGRLVAALSPTRRELALSAGFGFLNPFLYYLVLFEAYDLLPAQQAQPINYTWAITLALLSIPLLGQRLTKRDLLATLVSYLGVVFISTRGDPLGMEFESPLGVALALASTVIWALYWIYNTRDRRDPLVGLFWNFVFGTGFTLVYVGLFGSLTVPAAGLAGAAYVGTFEMGVTFWLWLKALKLSENTAKVGNLIFLSPFLSLVLIHHLVGEEIHPATPAGLVLIVAGLVLQRLKRRSQDL
jgi:drug/metabolite transporter (DMT)-like permease